MAMRLDRWRPSTVPVLLLACSLLPVGCEATRKQAAARELLDRYFDVSKAGGTEELLALYRPEFFDRTPRDEWLEKRRRVSEELGPIEDFEPLKWTMEVLPNGTFTTYECRVRYARDEAIETITIVEPADGSALGIFGHHIRPKKQE